MRKIIMLGLMKCGMVSFTEAFKSIGYRCATWKIDDKTFVGELILKAHGEHKQLLYYLDEYDAIVETEVISLDKKMCLFPKIMFYKELYWQNSDALFILNYRNIDNHVRSIEQWNDLAARLQYFGIYNLKNWIQHHQNNVMNFYKGKKNFMAFDIENDSLKKLCDFIGVKDINWQHLNKTV